MERRSAAWLLGTLALIVGYFVVREALAPGPSGLALTVLDLALAPEVAPVATAPTPPPLLAETHGPHTTHAGGSADGETILHGAWGNLPGQFGHKRQHEAALEAPMAIRVGASGEVAILDQVNRRIQRFSGALHVASIPIGGEAAQDFALLGGGRVAVLDRLGERNLQLWSESGQLENEVPLVGKGVPEGGGVTGLFSDEHGVYVEREHGASVRIADENGVRDPARPELLGRPSRDGRLLLQAAIASRNGGEITVRAWNRGTSEPAWNRSVGMGQPLLHIVMLDSDRHGEIYVAAEVGHESPDPPYGIVDVALIVTRLGPGGQARGQLTLPYSDGPEEQFRPVVVDDEGGIYVMVVEPTGLRVVRYGW